MHTAYICARVCAKQGGRCTVQVHHTVCSNASFGIISQWATTQDVQPTQISSLYFKADYSFLKASFLDRVGQKNHTQKQMLASPYWFAGIPWSLETCPTRFMTPKRHTLTLRIRIEDTEGVYFYPCKAPSARVYHRGLIIQCPKLSRYAAGVACAVQPPPTYPSGLITGVRANYLYFFYGSEIP